MASKAGSSVAPDQLGSTSAGKYQPVTCKGVGNPAMRSDSAANCSIFSRERFSLK
ncbi:hypothetical protein D3C84_1102990 [compost metagenome]